MALSAGEEYRYAPKGTLPVGVTMKVHAMVNALNEVWVYMDCHGTIESLQEAGYLSAAMLANRSASRKSARLCDEHGEWFRLHRAPTKAMPNRMSLHRRFAPEIALELPSVKVLFPDGMPKKREMPVVDRSTEYHNRYASAADWQQGRIDNAHGFTVGAFDQYRKDWQGQGMYGPRFRFAARDIERLDALIEKFRIELIDAMERATVIDTRRLIDTQRPGLRLVVDNTQ